MACYALPVKNADFPFGSLGLAFHFNSQKTWGIVVFTKNYKLVLYVGPHTKTVFTYDLLLKILHTAAV